MSSRDFNSLESQFRDLAMQFNSVCSSQDFPVLIYCCRRSFAEQDDLYAQGRTKPGHIITNAKAGSSAHNYGLAFDGAPTIGGKPLWDEPLNGPHWTKYGQLARASGLIWGGTWLTFKEGPHIEMPNWKQIAGIT